jgi:NDP-sugar pyrophosphorylase family protein
MERVTIIPADKAYDSWIDRKFIPEGQDKYYIRNTQAREPEGGWRHLTTDEKDILAKNGNTANDWDSILVGADFNPGVIRDNQFVGLVRIGNMTDGILQYHDLQLPIGITDSHISSCDIGSNVAIHNVRYLSHYIIGDNCMLFNIDEMACTDHSKFGNGIVKDGEPEDVRIYLEIMNETGCRKVCPFDGMIAADAYLWGKYIDDAPLQKRLKELTQARYDSRRGYYGTIGEKCVIKNSSIIKDVKIGECCYIKGASKIKNVTINSSDKEPTQIGENVIMVNGIVGYGCNIFYSTTSVRFILGSNSKLKYGARLINSFMGDNSTISCCEVLNNLIFPAHEQHHNNSFLIASLIMGQSNIAAGATLGSNHNSRANDGEIVAGRGFWPGLCCSIKHSCKFASFTLISKADYNHEMNIPFPFALISNNTQLDTLDIVPAFWWQYDMYALQRNSWKFNNRDSRVRKLQNIEFDAFAPDSMEEAIAAMKLLEILVAKAWLRREGDVSEKTEQELRALGHGLLAGPREAVDSLEVTAEGIENSRRKVRILKPYDSYRAYSDMIVNYAIVNVLKYIDNNPEATLASITEKFEGERRRVWINFGGQLMVLEDVDQLRKDIVDGVLDSWDAIHARYNEIWQRYPEDKLRHAYLSLRFVLGAKRIGPEEWKLALTREKDIIRYIETQVAASRAKDYDNPFRKATFGSDGEMVAAYGPIEDNSFIRKVASEAPANIRMIDSLLAGN